MKQWKIILPLGLAAAGAAALLLMKKPAEGGDQPAVNVAGGQFHGQDGGFVQQERLGSAELLFQDALLQGTKLRAYLLAGHIFHGLERVEIGGANQHDLAIAVIPMIIGFVLIMLERWKLNVLSLGEDEARSLGVNTKRTRMLVIVAATLLTSVSVAVSGVIGWIGLIIPHLARALVGPDHRKLLPAAMLLGASYLLIVDDFARCLLSMEIPIGILTAFLGVPFFAIIFHYNSKGWS